METIENWYLVGVLVFLWVCAYFWGIHQPPGKKQNTDHGDESLADHKPVIVPSNHLR